MNFSQTQPNNSPHHFLASLSGGWIGQTRTWFEPGSPAVESRTQGSFQLILQGRFAIYMYQSVLEDEIQHGMFTFGYNTTLGRYEASWLDSFHTGTAIMFCVGQPGANGFRVLGEYPDPTGGPDWGWRTEVELVAPGQLLITAYNISPEGGETRAIETKLERAE